MSVFSDAKADQFVYDENYDYINNKDKKTVVDPVVAKRVHEMFEVDVRKNIYGPFNALVNKLVDSIREQAKIDEYDETKYAEATYKAFFTEFETAALEMIKEKFDNFGQGDMAKIPATAETFVQYPNNPNYSGGPIPGKDYDKVESVNAGGENVDEGEENP